MERYIAMTVYGVATACTVAGIGLLIYPYTPDWVWRGLVVGLAMAAIKRNR